MVQAMDTLQFNSSLNLAADRTVLWPRRGAPLPAGWKVACHRNGLDIMEANNVSSSFLELSQDYLLYNP